MQTRAPSLSFVLKLIILSVLIVYGSGLLAQSSNAPCENVDDYGKSGEVVTEVIMDSVHLVTARTSDGDFIPMKFSDIEGVGTDELAIPRSDVGGIQHATLFMGDACGDGDLELAATLDFRSANPTD